MQLTPNHKMQIKYTSHSSQDHITHIQTEHILYHKTQFAKFQNSKKYITFSDHNRLNPNIITKISQNKWKLNML